MIDPKNIAVDAFKEECPECFSDLYFRNVLVPETVVEVMITWCEKCDRKELIPCNHGGVFRGETYPKCGRSVR